MAFAAAIGPKAATVVRRIRNSLNASWSARSASGGITDKGVVALALEVGLHELGRKYLRDARAWPSPKSPDRYQDVAREHRDELGNYVPVFRPYGDCSDLEN